MPRQGRGGRGHSTLGGTGAGRGNGGTDFLAFGLLLVEFGEKRQTCSKALSLERFRAHYGVDPRAIKALTRLMKTYCPSFQLDLVHLFMTMCWLRLYEVENVMAGRWQYGEKFCRETVRTYAREIRKLKDTVINFDHLSPACKFAPLDNKHIPCYEFRCSPSSKWWSHKLNGPGVGFEVVTNPTDKGLMMWASGPYPAATHNLTCFRGGTKNDQDNWRESSLYNNMPDGLRLVADSAYAGQFDKVTTTMQAHDQKTKELFARMKSMQETIFSRFSSFRVLSNGFRHGKNTDDKLEKIGLSFDAIAVLIQLDIQTGRPLFDV